MKRIRLTALLLLFVMLLSGCGSAQPAPKQALDQAVHAALADADTLTPFSRDDLSDLIGIEEADYTDWVYLGSADGLSAREAIVLRAKDGAAADRIGDRLAAYLAQRMDETRNYLPQEYQLLSQAKVERKSLTLALIVGEKAAEEARSILAGE